MSSIPPRCRLLGAARHRTGPAHAVKSSPQQWRALWAPANQRGLPAAAERFWILTMPAEIWSRIELRVRGPPLCSGSSSNFKTLWAGLQPRRGSTGGLPRFGKMSVDNRESGLNLWGRICSIYWERQAASAPKDAKHCTLCGLIKSPCRPLNCRDTTNT